MSDTTQKRTLRKYGTRLVKQAISHTNAVESSSKGGILAALRRSPLVEPNLDLTRSRKAGRNIKL